MEIIVQADGQIDGFCDFAGTGGSFAGCALTFKKLDPGIRCYLVEPEGAAVLSGEKVRCGDHPIQGGGYARDLPLIDKTIVDGFLKVGGEEAKYWARRLAQVEGIFAGYSAGANIAGAMALLEGEMAGRTIVVMICDSGLKYLSTDLWDESPDPTD